jgi:hypothetical protein
MFRELNLQSCWETVRTSSWDWFVTLKFPRSVSPKYKGERMENPEDAFHQWRWQVNPGHYIRVIEQRESGDLLFHVLLSGGPEPLRDYLRKHFRHVWWELSRGAAWDRDMNRPIEGLLKYFFYKLRCEIDDNDGFRIEPESREDDAG